VGVAAYVK
jgi:hypothetical protein